MMTMKKKKMKRMFQLMMKQRMRAVKAAMNPTGLMRTTQVVFYNHELS
jgi:hypothetical protein